MTCGLPTFATRNGGPAEIIKNKKSGFHIDPYHGAAAAELMADFFERCVREKGYWEGYSKAAQERIFSRYTWNFYAERLVSLCGCYSFWNHVTGLEGHQRETKRYLEAIYILELRRLIAKVR